MTGEGGAPRRSAADKDSSLVRLPFLFYSRMSRAIFALITNSQTGETSIVLWAARLCRFKSPNTLTTSHICTLARRTAAAAAGRTGRGHERAPLLCWGDHPTRSNLYASPPVPTPRSTLYRSLYSLLYQIEQLECIVSITVMTGTTAATAVAAAAAAATDAYETARALCCLFDGSEIFHSASTGWHLSIK